MFMDLLEYLERVPGARVNFGPPKACLEIAGLLVHNSASRSPSIVSRSRRVICARGSIESWLHSEGRDRV